MEEKEFNNIYAIPANYTDSGKLLGGMLETRNTIEAIIMLGLVGYPEIAWLHTGATAKVVIMTVTLIPLGVISLMGIGGDSAPKGERWGSPHAVQTCLLGVEGAHLFDALLQDFFIDKHRFKSIYKVYSWMFQGSPLMLQLYLVYYGLPFLI